VTGDGSLDQLSLDGFGSFVGTHCLNVGQVTHHMVLEQNAVAAQRISRFEYYLAGFWL
jgi:hypothetical protein